MLAISHFHMYRTEKWEWERTAYYLSISINMLCLLYMRLFFTVWTINKITNPKKLQTHISIHVLFNTSPLTVEIKRATKFTHPNFYNTWQYKFCVFDKLINIRCTTTSGVVKLKGGHLFSNKDSANTQ